MSLLTAEPQVESLSPTYQHFFSFVVGTSVHLNIASDSMVMLAIDTNKNLNEYTIILWVFATR
jgi:hypothetical protein